MFAGVYTDEGITGTNTKKREGFKSMVADALAGKIDLIITKSVSRFARNTVDSLTTIRSLKEHNVECYFEKENIWTFDGKGELLLTIMSSLAQGESRSIPRTAHGDNGSISPTARSICPTDSFSDTEKAQMVCRRSTLKKRKQSGSFTGCSWAAKPSTPLRRY